MKRAGGGQREGVGEVVRGLSGLSLSLSLSSSEASQTVFAYSRGHQCAEAETKEKIEKKNSIIELLCRVGEERLE